MEFGTNIFWVKFGKETKMQTQKDKIAEAAKFESKIDDTSRQDKLAQKRQGGRSAGIRQSLSINP